jgi:WD40 repeat protein
MTQQSGGGGDGFVGGGQQAHVPANRLTTSAFPVSTANNTHATTTTNATTTNNATNTTANNANNATTTHNAPSPSTTAATTPPPHVPDAPWTNTMTLQGHTGAVLCVCLNEAGSHCLTGGQDRTVKLWNPRNSNPTKNILTTFNDGRITHPVADIAVLPGSKRFVTCGGTTRALLWDLNTKQLSR